MDAKESESSVVVAQLGSRQDYSVPTALQKAGILKHLYTDAYVNHREARLLQRLARDGRIGKLARQALSRHNAELDYEKVTRFTGLGVRYYRSLRRASTSVENQYRAFIEYGNEFNRAILRQGLPDSTHIFAFDHAALGLFQSMEVKGRTRVLEQIYPAIHAERLEQEEEEYWPGWSVAPQTPFYNSSLFQKWREIQLEEWRLADSIIVASDYSKEAIAHTLPELKPKLRKVPLTVNLNSYLPFQHIRRHPEGRRPLRVLFAGNVNLRKGLPYLLSAFDKIDPRLARLTVVGGIQLQEKILRPYQDRIDFCGIVPHVQMPQIYHDADVFIFPTISDGFGAVMLEAMATGLPVISTNNCGDIVEDGVNGFRIPIRNPEAIMDSIEQFLRKPEMVEHLSKGAIQTSQQLSLPFYQTALFNALNLRSFAAS